ncbi:hypothetical protein HK103_002051 [Boothiomyces macroporosus]|uniref:Zn(2)-C6 fungal-type domain-containing protein n=1 Tax=Boothiomyces macroporosus TaxID=261099 RepID=A0AAD5Y4K2_9FUNG|nr:hypothetical protein HK103_002051 [Boothiomyces macroporosus]
MKLVYTCDYCIKRKRKCDRRLPCSLCLEKNIKCRYSQQETVIKKYKRMESRIRHLEMLLIMPFKHTWEHRTKEPPVERYQLSNDLEYYLFCTNHDYLIDLRFQKLPSIFSYVSREYFIESAKQFWPLRFSLYATAALYLPDQLIPKGLNNRIEMAHAYLEKAGSFNFINENSHLAVLTLAQLAFTHLRKNGIKLGLDGKEAYLYADMGLAFAKHLGMNTEAGLAKLSSFDYERENMRRTWWLLYNLYTINPKKFSAISSSDNQIFLPGNFYFEAGSPSDYYGIEIMSSSEWYIPCIPNQDFQAYRIILHKIVHNILNYVHLELLNETENIRYIAGSLNSSLLEWYNNAIDIIHYHGRMLISQNVKEPQLTWMVLSVYIMYNNARVELIIPSIMKNIIKGKKIENSLYFKEALQSCMANIYVLELIKTYNQQFEHLHAYIIYLLFVCAFLLQCCIKLPMSTLEIKQAYQKHVELLSLHGKVFQRTELYYKLILELEEMELYQAVLAYGEFRANGFSPLSKPTAFHVEMLNKLEIK